jgi:hypothetical protein
MNRRRLNFVVDLISLLALLALIETGLILKFVLPPGTGGRGGGPGLSLLDWTRHDWGDVHFWFAVGLVVLMLVHVVLHWGWLCGTVRRLFAADFAADEGGASARSETAYGVGFLLLVGILLGGLFWWGSTSVAEVKTGEGRGQGWRGGTGTGNEGGDGVEERRGGHGEGGPGGRGAVPGSRPAHAGGELNPQVRGSMTLREVEQATGVPVAVILRELGLPADTSADERLGQLRQTYGFEMETVRTIVQRFSGAAAVATAPS